ncbi:MAG: hypothetical protein JKY43_11160 [Phycisphaerales bacterium]|nr:hypothetical protein [Phycisphaerales bacterium]
MTNKVVEQAVVRFESDFEIADGGAVTLGSEDIRQFLRCKPEQAGQLVFMFIQALCEQLGDNDEERELCLNNILAELFGILEEMKR